MASTENSATVQSIYIAYYGRPADPAGLDYWANRLEEEGGNLTNIIDHFANSDESEALYGNNNGNEAAIEAIYMQLFDRIPDQEGKNYYLAGLNNPESHVTLHSMALDILLGAQGGDAAVVTNKLEFAQSFTGALDASDEAVYDNDDATASVKALMATVNATPESLSSALNNIPDLINNLEGHSQNFTLIAGVDNLEGGNNNDLFIVSEAGTLQSEDQIDGKEGIDILDIQVRDLSEDGSEITVVAPQVTNVEKIIYGPNERGILDMQHIEDVSSVLATNFPSEGGVSPETSHSFINADLEGVRYIVAGDTSINIDFSDAVDLSGDNDQLLLGTNDSDSYVFSPDAASIEQVSIEVQAGGENTSRLFGFTSLETISITGEGNLFLSIPEVAALEAIAEVDASGLNGRVHFTGNNTVPDVKLTGGSGADFLVTGVGNDTILGGDGDDSISTYGGSNNIDGGHGNDSVFVIAGSAIITGSEGSDEFHVIPDSADNIVSMHSTITDFSQADEDILIFDSTGLITFANTTISAGASETNSLNTADFVVTTSLADTAANAPAYDQKLVLLETETGTNTLNTMAGGAAAFYLLAQNSDEGKAQLWYDDDWSNEDGRYLFVEFNGVQATDFNHQDFGIA